MAPHNSMEEQIHNHFAMVCAETGLGEYTEEAAKAILSPGTSAVLKLFRNGEAVRVQVFDHDTIERLGIGGVIKAFAPDEHQEALKAGRWTAAGYAYLYNGDGYLIARQSEQETGRPLCDLIQAEDPAPVPPDCYEIRAYGMLDKTVLPGNATSGRINMPLRFVGKRVKVVILDPYLDP